MNPEVKTEQSCIWWKEDVGKVKRAQGKGVTVMLVLVRRQKGDEDQAFVSCWQNKRMILEGAGKETEK